MRITKYGKSTNRQNQLGMGLVEVLMAIGLFSLIGAGTVSLITNSSKQQRGLVAKDAMREFGSDVRDLLANTEACKNTFNGLAFDATGTLTVTQIKDGATPSTVRYNAGDEYVRLLKFESLKVQAFIADNPAANPNLGKAKLFIHAEKVGDTLSAPKMHQVLALKVLKNAANQIIECSTLNGAGADLWSISTVDTNNIFYSTGNVGIGTSNPTVKLEVNGSIKPGSAGITTGAACAPEGAIAYDLAAHEPVYCSSTLAWTKIGGAAAPAAAGITSCPAGMNMVGNSGMRATYCIDANKRTGAYADAISTCHGINDIANGNGRAHLCDGSEWLAACVNGLASDMTSLGSPGEWVAIPYGLNGDIGSFYATLAGVNSSCVRTGFNDVSGSYGYRCCIR